ncbi:uncharacterized protein LOC124453170 isoform X1 [Xenia sp. Carnegie-2017]|uniref:uncharacterized protein LOC124453170 isoform X1 n=1 Tax=Xenia sp. Carnegie-2017 TaxID=2897299 RepID=UPI001F0333B3|nr:uncharacterized protein LOC124453170 isoform X1 [Xenia sp. Carnegie-2017]
MVICCYLRKINKGLCTVAAFILCVQFVIFCGIFFHEQSIIHEGKSVQKLPLHMHAGSHETLKHNDELTQKHSVETDSNGPTMSPTVSSSYNGILRRMKTPHTDSKTYGKLRRYTTIETDKLYTELHNKNNIKRSSKPISLSNTLQRFKRLDPQVPIQNFPTDSSVRGHVLLTTDIPEQSSSHPSKTDTSGDQSGVDSKLRKPFPNIAVKRTEAVIVKPSVDQTDLPKTLLEQKTSSKPSKNQVLHTTVSTNRQLDLNRKQDDPSTSEFFWKNITKNIYLFSSYYDKRYLETKPYGVYKRSVATFGYEKSKLENTLYCVFVMDDNKRYVEEKPAVRTVLAELWIKNFRAFRGIMYRCNMTVPGTPRFVTLVESKNMDHVLSVPFTSFIPVVDSSSLIIHQFGVCYETPLYGNKYDQGIMDSIEMNKLLGATWFTIYVYEAHDKAVEILNYYSKELKILDAVMNWGENMPSPVYNRGLLVGIHDCLYRNMFRVRYLVLCDLDEIIMPKNGLNWHELMPMIDKSTRVYFSFRHLGFHKNASGQIEYMSCPGNKTMKYKMPRFFATHNRSENVLTKNRQMKSISKPRYSIAIHVHHWRWLIKGYWQYLVPTQIAVMKHFRDKDDPRYKDYNSTIDYSMDSLKSKVLDAIERHYCIYMRHTVK